VGASLDRQVRVWNAASGAPLHRLTGPKGQDKALAFSPDGKTLLVAGGDVNGPEYSVQVWDLATGAERFQLSRKDGPVASLSFSPGGRQLAVGGLNQTVLRLLDVATGKELSSVTHDRGLEVLAFAPDGRSLALAVAGTVPAGWTGGAPGKERPRFKGPRGMISARPSAADGNRLASSSRDMTTLVWDLTGPTPPATARAAKDREELWADLGAND